MKKQVNDILRSYQKSLAGCLEKNRQVKQDVLFAFIRGEQWDGCEYKDKFKSKPKMEYNKIGRAINRLAGQYSREGFQARIISNSDLATDEDAELLQARWRNDINSGNAKEAFDNSFREAAAGGFGAVKLVAKYEDEEEPDQQKQNICIEPVYSAASSVVFSVGAIEKDKGDATECWQLLRVNREATEEEYDVDLVSFPSGTNDGNGYYEELDATKDAYIAHYWEVRKVKVTTFDFNNGELIIERRSRKYTAKDGSSFTKEEVDNFKDNYEYTERTKTVKEVWHSLIDGEQYLTKPVKTPFKRVPIIPQYGYYDVIDGIDYYYGEVQNSKDVQMLTNMLVSGIVEPMSKRQIQIPEYAPEQLAGGLGKNIANEQVNDAAFRITRAIKDQNGTPIHFGPTGYVNPPELPSTVTIGMQMLEQMNNEQNGTGQSTLPSNTSAEAVLQVNQRQDDAYQPIFQNAMHLHKAVCQAWIPAAQELLFAPGRSIRVMSEEGNYSQVETMQMAEVNGEYGPYKNNPRGKYDVIVKAGEADKATREAERDMALQMLGMVDTNSEEGQEIVAAAILSTTGASTAAARKIARFKQMARMISFGIDPDPKTEEERQQMQMIMQQMQQPQQPDAMTIAAMAEQTKAQSDMLDSQVKAYNAETQRAKVQIDAQKAGAEIALKTAQTNGTELDNVLKFAGQQ